MVDQHQTNIRAIHFTVAVQVAAIQLRSQRGVFRIERYILRSQRGVLRSQCGNLSLVGGCVASKSDGVVQTTRDRSNAAIGRGRNGALTVVVATPSQNRAIFQSDGVGGPTRDSRNAALGRGRNGALTVPVIPQAVTKPLMSADARDAQNKGAATHAATTIKD